CSGPTTRCGPCRANGPDRTAVRWSPIVGLRGNVRGGSSVPLGWPVVPDVYTSGGRGATGPTSGRPAGAQSVQGTTAPPAGQRQPTTATSRPAAAQARSAVSGPTKTTLADESSRMYAASAAVSRPLTGTAEHPANNAATCTTRVSTAFSANTATRRSGPRSAAASARVSSSSSSSNSAAL